MGTQRTAQCLLPPPPPLTFAARCLRALSHLVCCLSDGSGCGAPASYAATRLLLSGCLSVASLLSLLRCLYSAQAVQELAVDGIVQTMAIARQLQAFSLLPACEAQAVRLLSVRSLLPLWSSARLLHEGLVLNCCTDFIVTRAEELLHSETLSRLPAFLLQLLHMLLLSSAHIARDEQHRQTLIALFRSRLQPEQPRLQDGLSSSPCRAASLACPATQVEEEEATLTGMIRRQRAQPGFDALTSLCALFFSPTAAGAAGGEAGSGLGSAAAAASASSAFSCWPLSSSLTCSGGGSAKACELPDCASLLSAAASADSFSGSRKSRQERRRRSDDQSAAQAQGSSRGGRRPSAPCTCDVTGHSLLSSERARDVE